MKMLFVTKLNYMSLPKLLACAWFTLPLVLNAATPTQQAYIKASNTDADDLFGYRVAISGDTMVVGAFSEKSNATGVNGNQGDDSFSEAGAAYIFVRSGTTWSQQAYLKASNTDAGDKFGISVAVCGDTVVVGAYGESSAATGIIGNQNDNSAPAAGAVYVFVRNGTNWTQQAYFKASNAEANDNFGESVAISGDTIVVGAKHEDSSSRSVNGNQNDTSAFGSGAAYIFVRDGTSWTQQAYFKASNTAVNPEFGYGVAVSGDTVVVGAAREGGASGAVYVFVRNGTNWSQQAYLKASNANPSDAFGRSVAVSGDTVVAGARHESSNATGVNGNQTNTLAPNSGAAYVFVRKGTNWTQQAYLKASDTTQLAAFGSSVSVSANTVVIGAPSEGGNSGAAYVFVRNGTNWNHQVKLKASNAETVDFFGESVMVSGETMLSGAYFEDSNATGVNGDQNNNNATVSGAAYVFTGVGVGPDIFIARNSISGYFIRFDGAPDVIYRLQHAASVTGPWNTVTTLTTPTHGQIEYHDTTPLPGQAFYRTVQP